MKQQFRYNNYYYNYYCHNYYCCYYNSFYYCIKHYKYMTSLFIYFQIITIHSIFDLRRCLTIPINCIFIYLFVNIDFNWVNFNHKIFWNILIFENIHKYKPISEELAKFKFEANFLHVHFIYKSCLSSNTLYIEHMQLFL